ncbi:MAG: cob(I)yrinic acid a,c-diamide adenosyltransferase, partial [bacterium]
NMSVYTKTGDKGETGIFSGKRLSKDSLLIEAIGSMDEANSWLGVVGGFEDIQKDLMTISSILAGADLKLPSTKTKKLEKEIDKLDKILPPLKHLIRPGGSETGAKLHFARTLVRRAERAVVGVLNKEKVKPEILIYLNRLSDYLFMHARFANFQDGTREVEWKREGKDDT